MPRKSPEPPDLRALEKFNDFLETLHHQRAQLFKPYPKQLEFIQLGRTARKRCLMAANQVGKTTVAGYETRCHSTGNYPGWWPGRKIDGPSRIWVGGPDMTHVRDNAQKVLFGPPDAIGTGMIEASAIQKIEYGRGIANSIDYALIRHISGGTSMIKFKSYDQDVQKWSGDTLPCIWFDEEPPIAHYREGLTRTNAGDNGKPGFVYLTLTPLLGLTEVARIFHPVPREDDAALVRMGLVDALHYSPEDIIKIAATYPEYERKARVEGKPQLGEGAVFPYDFSSPDIVIDLPERLRWWIYLGGIDFGGAGEGAHHTAAVEIGWDRESDKVIVLREHRVKGVTTPLFASTLRHWNERESRLPFSWPHDGMQHDRQSGIRLAHAYEEEGLFMLQQPAEYEDGGRGLEDSVGEINDRLATGRLQIVRHCTGLLEEMESYRREKGRIVKEHDDLISALRYALMMKRYGVSRWHEARRIKVVGLDADPLSN